MPAIELLEGFELLELIEGALQRAFTARAGNLVCRRLSCGLLLEGFELLEGIQRGGG